MSTRNSLFFSFLNRYASLVITIVSSMVIERPLKWVFFRARWAGRTNTTVLISVSKLI